MVASLRWLTTERCRREQEVGRAGAEATGPPELVAPQLRAEQHMQKGAGRGEGRAKTRWWRKELQRSGWRWKGRDGGEEADGAPAWFSSPARAERGSRTGGARMRERGDRA